MPAAPKPENDSERIAALKSYNLLDTPSEERFDKLTELAAKILNVPIVTLSLVDSDRVWFKSKYGIDAIETPRDYSFCSYVVHRGETLVVSNATTDDRFIDNPLVNGNLGIKFYAGVPLLTPNQEVIGAFAVFDLEERKFSDSELEILEQLAYQASCQVEYSLALRHLADSDQELQLARKSAELANQVKNNFIASLSHEVRTPLTATTGMLGLLAESKLTEEQVDMVSMAEYSAKSLLNVINDVFDFSQIESGQMRISPTQGSLYHLADELRGAFSYLAQEKNVKVTAKLDAALPNQITIDFDRIRQILLNLVGNAIKNTPSGGEIEFEMHLQRDSDISTLVSFHIKDTGAGVSEEKREKIQEQFYQNDSVSENGQIELGLSICCSLLQLMNSKLNFENRPDKGSHYWFTLECPKVYQHDELEELLAKESQSQKPLSILVAEDHPLNQKLILMMLEKAGHRVQLASDGVDACDLFLESDFDLVLMDVEMPRMNGEAAAREIFVHCREKGIQVPIIGLTAHVMEQKTNDLLKLGMCSVVHKPISKKDLFSAINKAVSSRAP